MSWPASVGAQGRDFEAHGAQRGSEPHDGCRQDSLPCARSCCGEEALMSKAVDGFTSATEMLQALRSKQVSAVELLDLHLERIERLNGPLNAVVIKDYDRA